MTQKQAGSDSGSTVEQNNRTAENGTENKAVQKTGSSLKAQNKKKTAAQKKGSGGKISNAPSTKLLINADSLEEIRIAFLENGKVEDFHVETVTSAQAKSNIYKGCIEAIEPNLQAAFVDIGTGKNGFLPFSDIHPEYYCREVPRGTYWKDLNIQEMVNKGQEVLVEVVKEATGNKGAGLSTYLSMPGRYVVLMPGSASHGISRKIEDPERRNRLKEIMDSVKIPKEIGYIVRTASHNVTKKAIVQDIRFQLNLWKEIKKSVQSMPTPSLVYKEQNIIDRYLRDHFTSDIQEILVDHKDTLEQVEKFLKLLPVGQQKTVVRLHKEARPIFNIYQVEEQIEKMYQPEVPLPSGGSIIINPTEALVAIDVNSGSTAKDANFEETIYLANMEAAEELARQLRLRDLGGLIVVDFIDMRSKQHKLEVEKKLKKAMKKDKAKVSTGRISQFGLLQLSRQRLGPPIQRGSYVVCQHCQGSGMVRSLETTALAHLRKIQTKAIKKTTSRIKCRFPLAVAQYLLNRKRAEIVALENKYKVVIEIEAEPDMTPAQAEISLENGA
ncbi:MAG: Rne/Rng family ribonuclease [Thermodesulfobacteriota bacterium]